MQIEELTLQTRHLAEQKAFYCSTLGLPLLTEIAGSITIQAGTTRLRFQETATEELYHLAFAIPRNTFLQSKEWVRERVPLLAVTKTPRATSPTSPLREWNREGEDIVFFPIVNARSFYCSDADSNILKFIAYYDLSDETAGTSNALPVLSVSEAGLPAEDVRGLATRLMEELGIEPFPTSRPVSDDFAYLGDVHGQLVIVRTGHPWMPTQTVKASVAPVHLTIRGQQERQIRLSPYPYTVHVHAASTEWGEIRR